MTPAAATSDGNTAPALANQLEQIVLNRIASGKLTIPMMPNAAQTCLALIDDPKSSSRHLARALEADPVLSLQVLRISNSAALGGGTIKSVEQAVTRIGLSNVKAAVLEASSAKLFKSNNPRIAEACDGVWEHSVAVAICARDVAALSGSTEAEAAYLAGLLHDIGKPIIAGMLLEVEKHLGNGRKAGWIDQAEWIGVMQKTHKSVGVSIVQKWNLPEAIQLAVANCSEYDMGDRTSIANIVRFANAIAKVQQIYVGPVDAEEANALVMVGRSLLGIEDEVVTRLSSDLKERARAAVR